MYGNCVWEMNCRVWLLIVCWILIFIDFWWLYVNENIGNRGDEGWGESIIFIKWIVLMISCGFWWVFFCNLINEGRGIIGLIFLGGDGILFVVLSVFRDKFLGRLVIWGFVKSVLFDLISDVEIVILFRVEIFVGEKLGVGLEELGFVLELKE